MTTVPDYRFDQPANVQSVTPAMYRARAERLVRAGGDWSPAMDLTLMEALGRGEGLDKAAKGLAVPMVEARARFFAIQRAMTSREYLPMEAQAELLAVLREAVTVVVFKSRRVS